MLAQAARRGERQPEQHEVERRQADGQQAVEAVETGVDLGLDRGERQVDLEHAQGVVAVAERLVGLDRRHPGGPVVVAVGVEAGEPQHALAARRLQGLAVDRAGEAAAVVGEHHVAVGGVHAKPQHAIGGLQPRGHRPQRRERPEVEVVAHGQAPEQRFDARGGHQLHLSASLGEAALLRPRAERARQRETHRHHDDQAHRGERDEHPADGGGR